MNNHKSLHKKPRRTRDLNYSRCLKRSLNSASFLSLFSFKIWGFNENRTQAGEFENSVHIHIRGQNIWSRAPSLKRLKLEWIVSERKTNNNSLAIQSAEQEIHFTYKFSRLGSFDSTLYLCSKIHLICINKLHFLKSKPHKLKFLSPHQYYFNQTINKY